jgi:hypothetical protein
MPKYYKIYDSKEVVYVTVDDGGAVIIRDAAGRKVFLTKYQAKIMKFGIENLISELFKDADSSKVNAEEIKAEDMPNA